MLVLSCYSSLEKQNDALRFQLNEVKRCLLEQRHKNQQLELMISNSMRQRSPSVKKIANHTAA